MSSSLLAFLKHLNADGTVVGIVALHGYYEVWTDKDILIGRDQRSWYFDDIHLEAPWISSQHMRIYPIVYDEHTKDVEPFVYAQDLSSNGHNTWLRKKAHSWEPYVLSQGAAVLLSHGDGLRLCDGTIFVYDSRMQWHESSPERDELRDFEKDSLSNIFDITARKLGMGGHATVFIAIDRRKGCQVACKVVKLKKLSSKPVISQYFKAAQHAGLAAIGTSSGREPNVVKLWREVELLRTICHPNIVQLKHVFHTKNTLYLIEELITGGDLSSYIQQVGGRLHEEDACGKVFQILKALEHLHRNGIVHRDIKPENVLLSVPSENARVILADFGGATGNILTTSKRMTSRCGTVGFMAPEVNDDKWTISQPGYTSAIDMWSVGCLTTALFVGMSYFVPSSAECDRRRTSIIAQEAAAACNLSKLNDRPEWTSVGPRVKEFIKGTLCLSEIERLTAKQALRSPWFSAGYRKKNLERYYERVIRPWRPQTPSEDFAEDLNDFAEANFSVTDGKRRDLSCGYKDTSSHNVPSQPSERSSSRKRRIEHSKSREVSPKTNPSRRLASAIGRSDNSTLDHQLTNRTRYHESTEPEDREIRRAAWNNNRGLMTAKEYSQKIDQVRQRNSAAKVSNPPSPFVCG